MTNDLTQCESCGVYTANGDQHVCVVYDGPPCKTCSEPTVVCQVGAPGIGTVRVCTNNHSEELTPVRELSVADVI